MTHFQFWREKFWSQNRILTDVWRHILVWSFSDPRKFVALLCETQPVNIKEIYTCHFVSFDSLLLICLSLCLLEHRFSENKHNDKIESAQTNCVSRIVCTNPQQKIHCCLVISLIFFKWRYWFWEQSIRLYHLIPLAQKVLTSGKRPVPVLPFAPFTSSDMFSLYFFPREKNLQIALVQITIETMEMLRHSAPMSILRVQ